MTDMNQQDLVEVLADWPQPDSVAGPTILESESLTQVIYLAKDGQYAVVTLCGCLLLSYGMPNDEALNGHPLFQQGLKWYTAHRILNSSKVAALERQNSVHPSHDPKRFLTDIEHFILTFKDGTFECIVRTGRADCVVIRRFASRAQAMSMLGASATSADSNG